MSTESVHQPRPPYPPLGKNSSGRIFIIHFNALDIPQQHGTVTGQPKVMALPLGEYADVLQ